MIFERNIQIVSYRSENVELRLFFGIGSYRCEVSQQIWRWWRCDVEETREQHPQRVWTEAIVWYPSLDDSCNTNRSMD